MPRFTQALTSLALMKHCSFVATVRAGESVKSKCQDSVELSIFLYSPIY